MQCWPYKSVGFKKTIGPLTRAFLCLKFIVGYPPPNLVKKCSFYLEFFFTKILFGKLFFILNTIIFKYCYLLNRYLLKKHQSIYPLMFYALLTYFHAQMILSLFVHPLANYT